MECGAANSPVMIGVVAFAVVLLQLSARGRDVVKDLDYAVDRGRIDSVEMAWRTRTVPSANARVRRLAQATLDSYRYRFAQAERELLALRRESLGDDVSRRAAIELARLQLARGYPTAALPWIDVASREARDARDTPALADIMLIRAGVASAQPVVFALLDSAIALGGDREPHVLIATLCRRGGVLQTIGQHRQARALLHDGAARAKNAGFIRSEARCRLALTVSFISTGETDSMRVQHFEVSRLAQQAGDLTTLGSNVQWAATYLARLGRPGLARANLDSAFKLGRLTGNDVINAYAALGHADLDLIFGDAKSAYSWLSLSDSLMRARGDAFGISMMPGFYARLAWLRNDYETVLRLTDSAVAQGERSGTAVARVAALGERSRAALRLGRIADAAQAYERRHDLTTRFQMRGYEPALLQHRAEIALWRSDYPLADSLFTAFGATLHATQYALKHDVLMYRAHSKVLAGEITSGEQLAREAGAEYTLWRASLTDPDDRRRAAQSLNAFGDAYGLPRLIAELVRRGRATTALELSEQRRARSLLDVLARNDSASLEEAVHVRQLQTTIPDRTALLEYVLGVGDAPTTLLVVTRDTVAGYNLAPASTLTPLITRLTSRLAARQDVKEVSRELAMRLLDPAQALLARGIQQLVIVPDGAINFVPFDALLIGDSRYVVDGFETSVAPSLTIAARWWRKVNTTSTNAPSLVFGDPAYARAGLRLPFGMSLASADNRRFARLPASGREARRVSALLGSTDLAVGADASEDRLRRSAGRQLRVLHIAGHAVADDWSSDRSFIALAPGNTHDGLLSIADLTTIDLRAELIVLSACRTARGEVIGAEGVQSLARPFLEKGSRAVVATTWAVEDRHAATLMERFYTALSRGGSVAQSLRDAKLSLRRAGASVSEWSAYTLLGDATLRIAPASAR